VKLTYWLTRPITGLIGAGLVALNWYAWRIEPISLKITRLILPVPNLPPAFEGYRIAHLSDLHLSVSLHLRQLPIIAKMITQEQPDLIAITGDFATAGVGELEGGQTDLAQLHAPDGVWAILGNHDYYAGASAVQAVIEDAGIVVLRNQHRFIQRGADCLVIAGVDDMLWGVPNLGAALDGAPHDAPVILMAHEPDYARIAQADPRVSLQLSGHTHGGQIRLPGIGALLLPKLGHVYTLGAYRIGQMALYVTSGTGTANKTIRFNCRPEIAVITLKRGERWNKEDQLIWKAERNDTLFQS